MTPSTLDYPWSEPPPAGAAIDVARRLQWVRMPLPFALDHINLWLLHDARGCTLVDTGYGDRTTRAAWDRVFADTLNGTPVTRIVATHYHPDHLGNAAWLAERFDTAVWMTQAEFLTAHAIFDQIAPYRAADTSTLFAAHGMQRASLDALAARGNRYRAGVPTLPERFRRLIAADRVDAGDSEWVVIPGFGHSPEHAALYSSTAGVLISGDMLLPRISTNVAVWPAEAEGDPLQRFLDSLTAFEALPPETLVLPSHGLPFRGIGLRVRQLRAHHEARLAELYEAVAARQRPVSAAEIVPVLFRRELDLQQLFFAMGEAIAHLNHLWHAGRLTQVKEEDGSVRFAA
ncbi:MAG TPA: MBL fold metallo-hydrolase [Casimicrobiaceae bacterium]|nr:MBL fold metallo-hydrolase [Casimicrobiaceae bacterium]